MKKLIFTLLSIILFSCQKDNIKNQYVGTKWTAIDDIAELIYGKTCTTSVEFLTESTCQEIDIRNVRGFGSGTFVSQGTYFIRNDSVYWKTDNVTIGGVINGSVMSTNMRTISGGKRIYNKETK